MQFTPMKDFFSPELQSQYCVGLSYTVKDDAAHAEIHGEGEVTWKDQNELALLLLAA